MIDRYGQLKIQTQPFAAYCNDLNSRTNQQELKRLADEGRLILANNPHYSYWQVHQLHAMKHGEFIILIDFKQFQWLSAWVNLYDRERRRTFATVKETDGVKILSKSEHSSHEYRLHTIAERLERHCSLVGEGYYKFLHELVGLHYEYQHYERYKLADALGEDIFALVDLMILRLGGDWDTISDGLGERWAYDRHTLRNLNIATQEWDDALRALRRSASACDSKLYGKDPLWVMRDDDILMLLRFFQDKGMPLFAHAAAGMVATGNKEYQAKFRRVTKYVNLVGVFVSIEYYLKDNHAKLSGFTLTQSILTVMAGETWFHLFESKRNQVSHATIDKLNDLLQDNDLLKPNEGYWAQTFLILCLVRNLSAHNYPTEHRYYGNLFGIALDRALAALFYIWKMHNPP